LITRRRKVFEWITGADHENLDQRDAGSSDEDAWQAFLAAHPELEEPQLPRRRAPDG
jgi:hypothetical protein